MSAVAIVLLALAIAADSRRPRLAEVVRSGDDVRALRMLDEGADPNQRDLKGMTPLMWAAVLGHIEVAGRLLDKGAALNAETGGKSGSAADTALTFAAANGNTTMVDFLLSRGAVPDRQCLRGQRDVHAVQAGMGRRPQLQVRRTVHLLDHQPAGPDRYERTVRVLHG